MRHLAPHARRARTHHIPRRVPTATEGDDAREATRGMRWRDGGGGKGDEQQPQLRHTRRAPQSVCGGEKRAGRVLLLEACVQGVRSPLLDEKR